LHWRFHIALAHFVRLQTETPAELQVTHQIQASHQHATIIGKPICSNALTLSHYCAHPDFHLFQQRCTCVIGGHDQTLMLYCVRTVFPLPAIFALLRELHRRVAVFRVTTRSPLTAHRHSLTPLIINPSPVLGIDEVGRYHDMDRRLACVQVIGPRRAGVPAAVDLPMGINPFSAAHSRTPRVSPSSVP